MFRIVTAVRWSLVLVFGTVSVLSISAAATHAPAPTIVRPPDRFFQETNALDVVVNYGSSTAPSSRRNTKLSIEMIVDGVVVEERALTSDVGISSFSVPVNPTEPIALIQVCTRQGGPTSTDRACTQVRAAGSIEFDLMRRSLEEMNEISDAVVRYSITRLGYRDVPQSLADLVPDFLSQVPLTSPLSSPYEYTTAGEHFALRLALPGTGEIINEDGSFTRLPRGAITDREAARLTRQQLTDLAQCVESYRVDNNVFPERIEDVAPYYQRFFHPVDPYGHPYVFSLSPNAYVLSSLGRDGLPGGEGFDADSKVANGMQLVATTPYRGRYEYLQRTFKDMAQISNALMYFQEESGRWPDSLSELVGGPWFSWPRAFTDDCGNAYEYHVYDIGFGGSVYQLRAHACNGVSYSDPWEDLLYFSADNAGHVSNPGWRSAYRWPGLFD